MFPAQLIWVVGVLLIAGVLLWAISQFPAIDATIRQIVRVLIIVIVAIWLIYILMGMFGGGVPAFHR